MATRTDNFKRLRPREHIIEGNETAEWGEMKRERKNRIKILITGFWMNFFWHGFEIGFSYTDSRERWIKTWLMRSA